MEHECCCDIVQEFTLEEIFKNITESYGENPSALKSRARYVCGLLSAEWMIRAKSINLGYDSDTDSPRDWLEAKSNADFWLTIMKESEDEKSV